MPIVHPHDLLDDVIVIQSEGISKSISTSQKEHRTEETGTLYCSDVNPFVIVGSQCGAAVLRGADIFAPGILAIPYGISCGETMVNVFVDIKDKTLQGTVTGAIDGSKYKHNSNFDPDQSHLVFIGKGIAMMSRKQLFESNPLQSSSSFEVSNCHESHKSKIKQRYNPLIKGVAVNMVDCIFDCPSLNENNLKDMYLLQNLPSLVTVHALMSVKSSANSSIPERILDMCSAPGNKTTHIASMLLERGNGKVIALDKSQNKVNQVLRNCCRFGVEKFVEVYVRDSTKLLSVETARRKDNNDDIIFIENSFDRILLDAPCSALGQRPQFNISMKTKELASFPKIQRKLFTVAQKLLKPGGILVYSTCTFTIEENEGLVAWALEKFHDNLIVEPLFSNECSVSCDIEKDSKLKGLSNLGRPGIDINHRASKGNDADYFRLARRFGFPKVNYCNGSFGDVNSDTIGFFAVKFKKK